ncbi:MAG: tRNA (adenosine(37)-N6)-threonylcarbamoyltransferase complex dimerization subunit type 1 TsaB [Hyphomicrobiales bacterium]
MLCLALDTCLGACSAALYDLAADRVLASDQLVMDKGHAEAIGPMVERLFAETGIRPGAVARVLVTRGPGTFTGLRIGLSFAQGFALANASTLYGVDTLRATAAPHLVQHPVLAIAHAAGATGKVYAAAYADGAASVAPCFTTLEEFTGRLPHVSWAVAGSAAEALAALDGTRFHAVSDGHLPSAAAFAALAREEKVITPEPQPLYLRAADAKPQAQSPGAVVRGVLPDDLAALARLHQTSFSPGWSADSLAASLALPGAQGQVALIDGVARAFIITQVVAGEAEILTLCTEPRWRHRGLARRLVAAALGALQAQGCSICHLEVAEDNGAARAIYTSLGFSNSGRRKAYYERPGKPSADAILMTRHA